MSSGYALIFDCDGTLVDSYDAIVDRICRVLTDFGFVPDSSFIREQILKSDSQTCVKCLCKQHGLKYEDVIKSLAQYTENRELIMLMDGCTETLQTLKGHGFRLFVYTHRGASTRPLFESLGIASYFEEIVDSTYGFKRKPSGEAIDYLVEKYNLDRTRTCYVGDRSLDIECGKNSSIGTIFLRSAEVDIDASHADYAIEKLSELENLL